MAIAIVDDTPLNLTLIQALVRKLTPPGTEIVTFSQPLEGLQWCGSNEPDLLIVDYMMPDINGIEVVIAEAASDQYIGDFALLVHKFLDMENLRVLFAVGLMNDRVHLVARSRTPDVDVGKIFFKIF